MKNSIYILFLLAAILFTSCYESVTDLEIEEKDPKIVMNGFLYSDSIVKVQLSSSIGVLETYEVNYIENAVVELWGQTEVIDTLIPKGNGFYTSSQPLPGDEKYFSLKAHAAGFETVTVYVEIPDEVGISSVDTINRIVVHEEECQITYDSFGICTWQEGYVEMMISFTDPSEEKNYYMLQLKKLNKLYIVDYNDPYAWDPETGEYRVEDTISGLQSISFESNDAIFEVAFNRTNARPVEEEFTAIGAVFSDILFNGKTHTIKLRPDDTFLYQIIDREKTRVYIQLTSINEDYYKFIKSLSLYADEWETNFFSEKVSVYTNVNHGLGLVGGANQSMYYIDFLIDSNIVYYY